MSGPWAVAQDQTATAQLLGKAHALEVRGRMDMAKQTWKQVLLVDPNNTDALAGMARAAKLEGKPEDVRLYLDKLRQINPNDPNIERVEHMGTAQDPSAKLADAGRLAQSGQYAKSMAILREVYGNNPPPGDAALSYYQTEAATDDGRPQAIAGLRSLVDKFPQDSRYQIALGKILTYNPRTRAEGRKLLQKHPQDPDASEALRQSLVWDAQNPATSGDIKAYLSKHKDQQLSTALAETSAQAAAAKKANGGRPARVLSPEEQAAQAAYAARSKEEQEAYAALNAKHIEDAEARFKAILIKNPNDWQAQAGLGYIRMTQSNFGGAISYLEQAKQNGAKDPAVEKALLDSRFYFTMQTATAALAQSDLVTAQQQFTAAEHMRPNNPEALLGLGGTLLKAQQPEAALPVFAQHVKVAPGDPQAWRGLFMSQYGSGKYNDALATDRRVPPKVKALLIKDPTYQRTLASVYSALGRDADAQRVLKSALELPFPVGAKGLKTDLQNQYAALLSAANHKDQAAGLYRQVITADNSNTDAWAGLVQTEHAMGRDPEAFQTLQTMPAASYTQAMQEPGFETTVAAIYEGQGHDDMAQDVLEKFLSKQQAEGRKAFVPAQIQLAGIYLRRGNSAQAYPLYRAILVNNPERADAWRGLLTALHSTGHDQDALAQIQQMPASVRRDLESDPAYLQAVGSIYAGLGNPQEAMAFMTRAQQHYLAEHVTPPADIDIQNAWLLYNSNQDAQLYRQLMTVGSRTDLTNQQLLTLQTIWTNFLVRRANQIAATGDTRRSIAILNAAAHMFPGNPTVLKILASGYASAGQAKEAVAIFRSQDLSQGSASDYKAAVGAALAANDQKDAEIWLRFGLDQYPRDPEMLRLAAKFEQARGDATRAAAYYRASLALMPENDPASELMGVMIQPAPGVPVRVPNNSQAMDLGTLLLGPDRMSNGNVMQQQQVNTRPYVPSYNAPTQTAPVMLTQPGAPTGYVYQPEGTAAPQGNGYPTYGAPGTVAPGMNPAPATAAPKNSTLKDYVPQSRLQNEPAMGGDASVKAGSQVVHLRVDPKMEAKYGPYESFAPGESGAVAAEMIAATFAAKHAPVQLALAAGAEPRVEFLRSSRAGDGKLTQTMFQQGTAPLQTSAIPLTNWDGTLVTAGKSTKQVPQPTAEQKAAAAKRRAAAAAAAKERAAAIQKNQADAPMILTGVSHPPAETYEVAPAAKIDNAQYNPAQMQGSQVPQAQAPTGTTYGQTTTYGQSGTAGQAGSVSQTGDSYGQQYPQPRGRGTTTGTVTTGRRRKSKPAPAAAPVETPAVQPAMNYPVVAQPLSNSGYPQVPPAYPLGQAPTDYQLQQRNLPPLRAYVYDPQVDSHTPLTVRDQTLRELWQIEGSRSGWVGGSVIGRYRSGTSGIDRLTALEVPFEASVVVGNGLRLTVIPKAVFLNNGKLDTTTGTLGTSPVLGTLPGNATTAPPQQFASGVGGEFQLTTNTFSAAIGSTPYQFLVSNVIGRVKWRPAGGHFTFFGGRDAVKETELSYAGLRDPGSANYFSSGPVWGGVVETGGGVRFDSGDEHSGLYIQGEGSELTGYHVLDNRKFAGTMGAYFRVAAWPEYGTLNVGGTLFGEHYQYNERGETYGLGGYFSPEAYFLAAIPVTFNGHYGTDVHYEINGSVGLQTFQEDNQNYFPLDTALQNGLNCGALSAIQKTSCVGLPVNSNTGLNYSLDAKASYRVNEHWYVGGFVTGNNTNNYNTISGGFFARYMFRPQYPTTEYPTGLFPAESTTFRPMKVP